MPAEEALLNADLHCHSHVSDGKLSPAALAERAAAGGVGLWALTDHDELGGQAEAREAALDLGLAWLAGVEVSVSFAGETVHIVGLGLDPDDAGLQAGLASVRAGRTERARAMGEGLARIGLPGAYEGALRYVHNPNLVSRTHFARWLVETGVCETTHEVFRRYLTEGKPGYVPHRWAGLGDTVRWITGAGGIAVIAHPGRYRFSPTAEYALITEFMAHGGRGIEVVTGSHSAAEALKYADTAREFGLLASRGSDFHAPGESRTDLGALPWLPGDLDAVWDALGPRIARR
ncbi:PHP domain-containing protein [Piscinibacter sp. Jin2]|uniref:PHP domain-containing protein n=1 Tax=Aquariibacter lacus TaxID=2801332 RepID=A0A9X1BRY7_9BURK|nr:3',5'-nucleoside bisphosphate phosphatase [Piscinibacter lacus]MBL0720078.1 PHP domain-containing protein [Piscinibacter lacus]